MTVIHPARAIAFDDLVKMMAIAVNDGLVRVTERDGACLYVYTKDTVYDRMWNHATMLARGLILDHTARKVIATPFPKFFNVNERGEGWPDLPFEIFEKVDGSLIITYWHGGRWRCATKGSLNVSQARWAEHQLAQVRDNRLIPGSTYLFEAVYADNRIVIRYPKDELVLLAAYAECGTEATYEEIKLVGDYHGWRVAQRFPYAHVSDLLARAKTLPVTEEGFVLRFANGLRLKVKGDEYCRVHRLISGCTPLALWEAMMHGQDLREIRRHLPEEFWTDFDKITGIIGVRLATLLHQVDTAVESVQWDPDVDDREIGKTLAARFPGPWADFVFHRRKKGTLLPAMLPGAVLPTIRRSVFMQVRPTANRLDGYTPSSAVNRVQEDAL